MYVRHCGLKMTKLSPEAQAVLDAYEISYTKSGLVAALRALVGGNAYEVEGGGWYSLVIDVSDIYDIADELEALNDV
jgi:hypothetical protein